MFILCTVYNSTTVKVGLAQDGVEGQRLFKQLSFRGFNGLSFPTWPCWILTSKVPLHRMLKWSYYGQWNVVRKSTGNVMQWSRRVGSRGVSRGRRLLLPVWRVWSLNVAKAARGAGYSGAACSDISSSQSEARDHLLSKAARQNLP